MRTVSPAPVADGEAPAEELPERVREALGELAGAAREGLLALSVGVGLGVLHALMEAEVVRGRGSEGAPRHRARRRAPWA
jgi:putative transposase